MKNCFFFYHLSNCCLSISLNAPILYGRINHIYFHNKMYYISSFSLYTIQSHSFQSASYERTETEHRADLLYNTSPANNNNLRYNNNLYNGIIIFHHYLESSSSSSLFFLIIITYWTEVFIKQSTIVPSRLLLG